MKTIGLIGGMSWESTMHYYQRINELLDAHEKLRIAETRPDRLSVEVPHS